MSPTQPGSSAREPETDQAALGSAGGDSRIGALGSVTARHPLSGPTLADVLNDIADEMHRARDKFGKQLDLTDLEWLAILAEEFGEAAMDVTKREVRPVNLTAESPTSRDLRAEIVQVAAVAARWVHAIDERNR